MAGAMVYRLRTAPVTAAHMTLFRDGMRAAEAIGDNRGYNHIAGFHGAPNWFCWHHQFSRRTPVQARLFLPWHRAYLWWLEQALQDQVPGASLPWWDWRRDRSVPRAYRARRGDGGSNPLAGSRAVVPNADPPIRHRTRRQPGANPGSQLPTMDEVASVLDDTDWASF